MKAYISKNILGFSIIVLLLSSCNEIPNEIQLNTELNTFIDDWHLAATKADFEGYFGKYHEDGIFIGTDSSELWDLKQFKDFSKPYFDKGRAWDFKKISRNLYYSDDFKICWFDELLDTWMGSCRSSGILVYKEDKWQIMHYHLSMTVPNDKIQNIISIINDPKEEVENNSASADDN